MKTGLCLREIKPTIFLAGSRTGLRQLVDVSVVNSGVAVPASILVAWGNHAQEIPLGMLPVGETTRGIRIAEIRKPVPVNFTLKSRGKVADHRNMVWLPPKRWVVHVVHASHHDVGYTDLASNVLDYHAQTLDEAIDLAGQTRSFPDDARFRIVIEQAWSLLNFLRRAKPERVAKMLQLLRSGRFEVTALFGNMTTEICGPETLIRALYPAFNLKRQYRIPIVSAEHNDIPGISWGLCQALTAADVKIFCPGIPSYYAWGNLGLQPTWDEKKFLPYDGLGVFWWAAPSGRRILFWATAGAGGDYHPGMNSLVDKLRSLSGKYPYSVIRWRVNGGARDNAPYIAEYARTIRDWNAKWAYPHLVCSTNAKFYADIRREIPDNLPVYRGEMHGEDYPVGATSTAGPTAVNRNNHASLITAEKIAVAASVLTDYGYQGGTLARAYEDVLYHDEHSWGHHFPCGPTARASELEKAVHALRAAALAHDVSSKALARIADRVKLNDQGFHLVVFNASSGCRTGAVRAPLREIDNCGNTMKKVAAKDDPLKRGYLKGVLLTDRWHANPPADLLEGKFDLVDVDTGCRIPFQIINIASDDTVPYAAERSGIGSGGKRYGVFELPLGLKKDLCFIAGNVPAFGYRTYRLVPRPKPPVFAGDFEPSASAIENEFYAVAVDRKTGLINSLYDKAAGRELVDRACPHGFGALIVRNPAGRTVSKLKAVRVSNGLRGPICASIEITGSICGHPVVRQSIMLYRGISNVYLNTRVLKSSVPLLDAHIAFPFLTKQPVFRYEGPLAVMMPFDDYLDGSCADNIAVQNWVKVNDGGFNILWASRDAPVAGFSRLSPGYVSPAHSCVLEPRLKKPLRSKQDLDKGWIYSHVFYNNFGTNFAVTQAGDMLFRYVISSGSGTISDSQAVLFGWQAVTDFEQILTEKPRPGRLPSSSTFLEISDQRIILLAGKQAEDDQGRIFRFWNPEPEEITASVRLPYLRIKSARLNNAVEEDIGGTIRHRRNDFTLKIAACSLVSVRIISWPDRRRKGI